MHILIIDDDVGDAKLVTRALDGNTIFTMKELIPGYENGMMALKFYRTLNKKFLPDAIVQEAKFNGGSAVELIRYAKSDKKLRDIPIIIYTGTDDECAWQSCLAAGAKQIVSKTIHGPVVLVTALIKLTA